MVAIIEGCYSTGSLFLICELGDRTSNLFNEFDEIALELSWYRFPNEAKRLLPIISIVLQEPVTIWRFGSASCDRECFKKVRFHWIGAEHLNALRFEIDVFFISDSLFVSTSH